MIPEIPAFPIGQKITLPAQGSWPTSVHIFDARSANAITAALAAQRPLLVRGEPGTGKSQLARAAAQHLGRLFVAEVVHARSESQDLQWHFDAVARLGEAQALGASCGSSTEVMRRLDPLRYLAPGALWWVFDWQSAVRQYTNCPHYRRHPLIGNGWTPNRGSVLLIDEIDKADADLPNGLLETLGNGAFHVPYLDEAIGLDRSVTPPPLVVITTNEERELPAAFVRRCLVLHLRLPKEQVEGIEFLVERGACHFDDCCREGIRRKVAEQLWADRETARRQGGTPPGQAEYLDILRALTELTQNFDDPTQREERQLALLDDISEFALKKFVGHGDS